MAKTGVILRAGCLLSKWGFNDGDAPDAYLDWLDEQERPYPDDWHGLLRVLVRTRLLPHIREDVEVEAVGTIHNPIRLARLGGLPVQWDGGEAQCPPLVDVAVNLPFSEVWDMQQSGITA